MGLDNLLLSDNYNNNPCDMESKQSRADSSSSIIASIKSQSIQLKGGYKKSMSLESSNLQ